MVFKRLHGLDVAPEEFIPFGGQGEEVFLGGVANKYMVQGYDSDKAIALFFDLYINTFAKPENKIGYPGAVELVRACRAAGLKVGVGSSAGRAKVDANLAAAGFKVADDFDAVISATDFLANKPAPDIFLAGAAEMGVPPSLCVVLEDAPAGVQAAKSAGMAVLAVLTTLSAEEMAPHGPTAMFKDISEITVADLQSAVEKSM